MLGNTTLLELGPDATCFDQRHITGNISDASRSQTGCTSLDSSSVGEGDRRQDSDSLRVGEAS